MPNKIYQVIESAITFKDSGGSAVITLQNLAASAVRISARYDRGAGSLPRRYQWRAVFQWTTTPTLNQYADVYLAESDGTYADGTVGTADASIVTGQLLNLFKLGFNRITVASAATNIITSGECRINDRYFSVAVYNRAAVNFQNTANVSFITFTPIPDELQ